MSLVIHETAPPSISACCIDIDATITDSHGRPQMGDGYLLGNAIFDVILELMCEEGWNRDVARNAIEELDRKIDWWDYSDFLKSFKLPETTAWQRIVHWHEQYISVYDDAVRMVKRLHTAGVPLFIVSNNPVSGCLLKLHRAGLSGIERSEYFRDILGTDVCLGLKDHIDFWERCLDRTGFAPEQIAVIGDNPKDDCAIPRALGVKTVFLVDRKLSKTQERTEDAFLVNTLDCVADLLLPAGAC